MGQARQEGMGNGSDPGASMARHQFEEDIAVAIPRVGLHVREGPGPQGIRPLAIEAAQEGDQVCLGRKRR